MGLLDRLKNAWRRRSDTPEARAIKLLEEGITLEEQGNKQASLERYDAALKVEPALGRAHFNRGNVLLAMGNPRDALESFERALKSKPDSAGAHYNKGNALRGLGRLDDALSAYKAALLLRPDFAEVHVAVGATQEDLGRIDAAIASYREALGIRPDYAEVYFNLGHLLVNNGSIKEAIPKFRRATEINPEYAEAFANLGAAQQELGDLDEAITSYRVALQLAPDSTQIMNNLGVALRKLGQLDDAQATYRRALDLHPDFAEAICNLGAVFQDRGLVAEAIENYRKAIAINPNLFDAHNNLGVALQQAGQLSDSIACYRRTLEINPDFFEAQNNLGSAQVEFGRLEEAAISYKRALEMKPDFTRAQSNLLFIHNYLADQTSDSLLAEALHFDKLVSGEAIPFDSWNNAPDPARCLRVGIVSGDLRQHPVGFFLESIVVALASAGNRRLELYAYSNHPQFDSVSERIKGCCRAWRSVLGLSDSAVAGQVRDDGIDILIDLSGHTGHNRLPVFAWKPAPIQASWLGYFATTGVSAIDYLIADPWTLPESEEANFSETIWRLPETRLCFTPPNIAIDVGALPSLDNGVITFGCFNNLTKVNDQVMDLWARILTAVPNSRLFLKTQQFREQSAKEEVKKQFAMRGIDSEKLLLESYAPRADYLAAYNRVDIALDPFPYTGGTTTVEALWMGVPVLTLAGKQFLARQGVGLMMNAGLSEWVASSEDDYLAKAIALTSNLGALAVLRAGLRQQVLASPIFDAPRFAQHFEAALRGMWEQWCQDQSAQPSEQTQPRLSVK